MMNFLDWLRAFTPLGQPMPFYRLPLTPKPMIYTPKACNMNQIQDLFSKPEHSGTQQPTSWGLLHLLHRKPHFTGSSEATFLPLIHGEDVTSLQILGMLSIHSVHDHDFSGSPGLWDNNNRGLQRNLMSIIRHTKCNIWPVIADQIRICHWTVLLVPHSPHPSLSHQGSPDGHTRTHLSGMGPSRARIFFRIEGLFIYVK